ncbi:MAG: hypothetical protein MJH09_01565 [Cetobacterium sp.]|nr:hypothetical protein [Cetobacterium sp.]
MKKIIFIYLFLILHLLAFTQPSIPVVVKANVISSKTNIVEKVDNNIYQATLMNNSSTSFLILIKYDKEVKLISVDSNKTKEFKFKCADAKNIKIYKIAYNEKKLISTYEDMLEV